MHGKTSTILVKINNTNSPKKLSDVNSGVIKSKI